MHHTSQKPASQKPDHDSQRPPQQSMEEKARRLLEHHKDKLDTLATALLEHETLEVQEVDRLLHLDGASSSAEWEIPEEVSVS